MYNDLKKIATQPDFMQDLQGFWTQIQPHVQKIWPQLQALYQRYGAKALEGLSRAAPHFSTMFQPGKTESKGLGTVSRSYSPNQIQDYLKTVTPDHLELPPGEQGFQGWLANISRPRQTDMASNVITRLGQRQTAHPRPRTLPADTTKTTPPSDATTGAVA